MIERMISDRDANVVALRQLAADSSTDHQLQSAVAAAVCRWDAVRQTCDEHAAELASIERAAEAYRDRVERFVAWLDTTEQSAAMVDDICADSNKVKQQLQLQEVGPASSFSDSSIEK